VKAQERKFKVRDKVLLLLPTDANKLLMHWKAPFEIVECRNDNNYRVQLPGHANMLKKYIERRKEEGSLELVGAAVIEESQGVKIGEIAEFVGSQKEDYTHVNVNPELTSEHKEEMTNILAEFSYVFTDVPKVTTLGVLNSINLTNM